MLSLQTRSTRILRTGGTRLKTEKYAEMLLNSRPKRRVRSFDIYYDMSCVHVMAVTILPSKSCKYVSDIIAETGDPIGMNMS